MTKVVSPKGAAPNEGKAKVNRALLVTGDWKTQRVLPNALGRGLELRVSTSISEAKDQLRSSVFDLLILDRAMKASLADLIGTWEAHQAGSDLATLFVDADEMHRHRALLRASRDLQLSADDCDEKLGIETEGIGPHNYGPVRAATFDAIMDANAARLSRQWFVDIGSGKGRAVVLAAQRAFQKIVGVERNYSYCVQAKRNIARASRCVSGMERVSIQCTDAFWWLEENWPVHRDIFVFMYCPFDYYTLNDVPMAYPQFFSRLAGKADETGTHITLAFVNPLPITKLEGMLGTLGFAKIAENEPLPPGAIEQFYRWIVYEK